METFLLEWVQGEKINPILSFVLPTGWWRCVARCDEQNDDAFWSYPYRQLLDNPDAVFVVVYNDAKDSYAPTLTDVEIGYHERRLTTLQRLKAILYVTDYWTIPF